MTKRPYSGFLGQFKAAQNEARRLPQWMKDSAKVATLTFPTTKSRAPLPARENKAKV